MKQFLFFLVFALWWTSAAAQIRRYTTQAEVDSIGFNDIYAGELIIGPDTCCSDIHDLSPLHNFFGTEIGFRIQNNPRLKSLHGLEQLYYVQNGGVIRIINNDSLTNLVGLADSIYFFPTTYQKQVLYIITDNERLADLQGIPAISAAGFEVRRNATLASFDGCQHLDHLTKLTVYHCPNLQSFHGLEGVDTLESSLFLRYLPRLKNMQGLNNCRRIGYTIDCQRLDSLENTDGLSSLRSSNSIYFDSCARFRALTNLERLGKPLFSNAIREMMITNCPWFGDFSGLSDTAYFGTVYLWHVDSIETVKDWQRLHANTSGIGPAYNLRYLDALPWGFSWLGSIIYHPPTFGVGSCPNLLYIRDTLPGRVDTMYNLGISLCPKLGDVSGLRYVKGITNQLELMQIGGDSLIGLENLTSCHRAFIFSNFKDFQFLRGLDSVATDLSFSSNHPQVSLNGLEHLRTVGYLAIAGDTTLRDLSPLEDSLRIKRGIYLSYLNSLDSITGFNLSQQLSQSVGITQYASIERCSNLRSISGFQGVTSLAHSLNNNGDPYDNLSIRNNPALGKITGFRNLTHVKKGFNISNNASLGDLSGFCHLFQAGTIGGIKTIGDNAPGANSYEEALGLCNASATRNVDGQMAVSIYPNPAATQFVVRLDGAEGTKIGRVVVSDLAGRVRLTARVDSGQTLISCASLPPGMYLVHVRGEGLGSHLVKLVITEH